MQVGRFTLRFDRITPAEDAHMSRVTALVSVSANGESLGTMEPEKRFYKKPQQPTTEVANRSTLREDLYVVLGSYDQKSELITILAYVNPLVVWIWIGGLVLAIGTAVTAWPSALERRALVPGGALEAERA